VHSFLAGVWNGSVGSLLLGRCFTSGGGELVLGFELRNELNPAGLGWFQDHILEQSWSALSGLTLYAMRNRWESLVPQAGVAPVLGVKTKY